MEEHSADVVQMPSEREEALPLLVVPHLDLVVVATRNKQGLGMVESHTTDRTYKRQHPEERRKEC